MATGTQTQTAWALWIRDLAETLEKCVAEVKHQGEPKLWHPKSLTCGRLLHTTTYWKNIWAAAHWASAHGPARPQPHKAPVLQAHQATAPQACRVAAPLGPCPTDPPGPTPQASQASTPQAHWAIAPPSLLPTGPLDCHSTMPPSCRLARPPPHRSTRSGLCRTIGPPLCQTSIQQAHQAATPPGSYPLPHQSSALQANEDPTL
jgi:hypothetical protein